MMKKSIQFVLPLVRHTVKRPTVAITRRFIQPVHVYRPFTTTINDTTTITRDDSVRTTDSVWNTYLNQANNITKEDFDTICKYVANNKELKPNEKIEKFQHILRDIHNKIASQPEFKSTFRKGCNMLMQIYILKGDLKSAKLVFEGLVNSESHISSVSIKTIIHGIQHHSTRTDLYKFIQSLEKRQLFEKEETSIYISILYALKHFKDVRGCQFYFAEMMQHGLEDETSYKIMMSVYKQSGKPENVLELFNTMKEKNILMTAPIYNMVLSTLSDNPEQQQHIFNELKKSGLTIGSSIYLTMKIDPMEALKEMTSPVIRDYNEFFAYYVRNNQFKQALDIYQQMKRDKHVQMDVYSYSIVMDVISKDIESTSESVFELYQEMKDNGIKPDPVVYTLLLSVCKKQGDLDRGMSLLEEMESFDIQPNEYTFNNILGIISTMQHTSMMDLNRASLIWEKMTRLNIHPSTRTYNIYLSILSKLIQPTTEKLEEEDATLFHDENLPKTTREMLNMYRYMRRNHYQTIQPDFATYSIVINSLSISGQLRSAMQVYSDAKMSRVTLPVSSYNEIMRALQKGGKMSEAMNVWYDMKIYGILPDNTTYDIILETCEQLGLSDTLITIRNQRKLDINRLLELDSKKEKRMKKSF